jgi:hypothetical protein
MVNILDVLTGDILTLKKGHPCGSNQWLVMSTGLDFRLKCVGCDREILIERVVLERKIKSRVVKSGVSNPEL